MKDQDRKAKKNKIEEFLIGKNIFSKKKFFAEKVFLEKKSFCFFQHKKKELELVVDS